MRKHLFYLLLFLPFLGLAQEWNEVIKLEKENRQTYDYFGNQVAISGDYAVVGMMNLYSDAQEGESFSTRGAANVYKWDGENWVFQQKLVASDAAQDDYFGYSGKGGGNADEKVVAIDGEYIVVSAFMEDEDENGDNTINGSGSAYIFKLEGDTWVEKQKIVASDRSQYASFGSSLAINGESLLIGSKGSSSAYVFQLENEIWTEKQKMTMPLDDDGVYTSEFGKSTAIDGNQILIGANQTYESMINVGVVYVYQKNGELWEIQQTLSAPTRFSGAYFGCSIAVSGDYLVVGAFYEDDQGVENFGPGAAYIFKKNETNWEFHQKIVAWDGRAVSDQFGISVSIDGENLLVGAWGEDEDENGENTIDWAGSAYLFKLEEGNWISNQKIVASDRNSSSSFGGSVALRGNRFIIGAESEFEGEFQYAAGSSYIFQMDCPLLNPEVSPLESICSGESTSITVNSESELTNWYDSADAETPIFTGTTFQTPILTETTSYWVTISTEFCVSELTEVIVNVNPLPLLETETTYTICSGNEASLYASSPSNVIFWYANEDDTEYLYHGNLFVTEVLTENTTY
ncbi:Ig-like domain-containing protein, partial [Moheibacter sediminis]